MKIWEMVKAAEEAQDKGSLVGEAIATMIVNFGKNGECRPGLITGNENILQMVVTVFEFYEMELQKSNKANPADS